MNCFLARFFSSARSLCAKCTTLAPSILSLIRWRQRSPPTKVHGPPLTLFVGPPDFSFRDISFSLKDEVPDPLKNYVSLDDIKLVPFKEQPGEKRFLATLDFRSKRALLRLHPKGFDPLGRGVNYYAPVSVGLLLRHLAFLQSRDPDYIRALSLAASLCGEAFLLGKVTLVSQPVLAFEIAAYALHPTE